MEENINDERFAKWHEKLIYYRFYPTLEIWLSKKNDPSFNEKGTSKTIIIPSQTYYGGPWVNTGFFKYIKFKTFAIHIKLVARNICKQFKNCKIFNTNSS